MSAEYILTEISSTLHSDIDLNSKMQHICDLLFTHFDHYDWVGFYLYHPKQKILQLGPFSGKPTIHSTIPLGKGICGQAVAKKKTFLIDDVTLEENYIACSVKVKSEIVVPIIRDQVVYGQIDIDSYKPSAFNLIDKEMLEKICNELANYF